MKTSSDELFQLIRSLDSREKAYFKTQAGSDNYIKLFDIINSLKGDYDEQQVKAILGNKAAIKNLKFNKTRLTETILRSMEKYHSADSVDMAIAKKLQQIEFLYNKALYPIALKIINKTLKSAIENESFLYTLKLHSWKSEILKTSEKTNDILSYLDKGFKEETDHINKYIEQREYYKLQYKLVPLLNTKQIISTPDHTKNTRKILSHPLLKNKKPADMSYSAAKYYYNIMAVGTRQEGDWERSNRYRKEFVLYLESDKTKLHARAHNYIMGVHNLLMSLRKVGNQKEHDLYYNKVNDFINTLPKKYKTKNIINEYIQLNIEYMNNQLDLFNYDKVISAANETEKLKKDDLQADTETHMYFYYFAFLAYFNLNKYKAALRHLNKIMDYADSGILPDFVYTSKLIALIVHFELGDTELLIGMERSTQRYLLKKRNTIYEFEKVILELFGKKIHIQNSKTELTELFIETKQKLELIFKNTREVQVMEYFDLIAWLDSKITGRSFSDLVKEKAVVAAHQQKRIRKQ